MALSVYKANRTRFQMDEDISLRPLGTAPESPVKLPEIEKPPPVSKEKDLYYDKDKKKKEDLRVIKRRAPPTCNRCRNHGNKTNYRNGHKRKCPHRNCRCTLCCLTAQEQRVMACQTALTRQQKQDEDEGLLPSDGTYHNYPAAPPGGSPTHSCNEEGSEKSDTKQTPQCTRCRNHDVISSWKGHKNQCEFRHCQCDKCIFVTMRKKLREKKNGLRKEAATDSDSSDTGGPHNTAFKEQEVVSEAPSMIPLVSCCPVIGQFPVRWSLMSPNQDHLSYSWPPGGSAPIHAPVPMRLHHSTPSNLY